MYFEQFYLGCLAHASYMLGSAGEAAVVDPQRDVEIYVKAAEEQGLQIKHIFETHLHADFVSGHRELARRTGAKIYIGAKASALFPHTPLREGYEVRFGDVQITAIETPGHTAEGISLVIRDLSKSQAPWAVLTGDTLFIGDVGRPDLSPDYSPQQLAGMMFDSLHKKLLSLPDSVLVYPAHGAGSLCGRNMRQERSSTIGTERLTNVALQTKDRNQFIEQLTANLPPRPAYFAQDAELNREGAEALSNLPPLQAIQPAELKGMLADGVIAIDTRLPDEFAAAHVPGSISIPLSGQFASWAGTLLGLHSNPVLIAESQEKVEEARMRLARVGIEEVRGFLQGGVEGWQKAGYSLQRLPQLTVQQLQTLISKDGPQVLDVRRQGEWEAGHIEEAQLWPLDSFPNSLPELDKKKNVAVHCKSGYRSTIASSLLLRAGYQNVSNVIGGFDAWHQAQLPEVQAATR